MQSALWKSRERIDGLQPRQCSPRGLTRESLGIREGFLCIRTSRFPARATGDCPHLLRRRRHRRYAVSRRKPLSPQWRCSHLRDYPHAGISRPSIRGKTIEFCILHTSSFPFLLSVSAPRTAAAKPSTGAKLQGAIAKAQRHAEHASTDFSEACTAYLRVMSR